MLTMVAATGDTNKADWLAFGACQLNQQRTSADSLFHCAELGIHGLLLAPHLLNVAEHFADLVRAQPDVLVFNI